MEKSSHQARLEQILERLETRSRQCPGMFPITTQPQWQQLALLHNPGGEDSTEVLWQTLESFDRDPELSHQALNRLLAQHAPLSLMSVNTDPKETARSRREAITALLAPDEFDYNKKLG